MQFLSPLFWIAGAALTIPVLLHLVRRPSRNKIPFASLMLVPRRSVSQLRRRKVDNWLLLLLRCLGLLLLVAGFSRPVLEAGWVDRLGSLSPSSTVILLDHSLSMGRQGVWKEALQRAKEEIESLREQDEGLLVLFSDYGSVVSRWSDGGAELQRVLDRSVEPSSAGTDYLEGLKTAVGQFEGNRFQRKKISLITDLQRSGIGPTQGWKVPADIELEIEDVGQVDSNLFVGDASISHDVFGKSYPHPLLIQLKTDPPAPRQGEVQLFLNGDVVSRKPFHMDDTGQAQVTLPPFDVPDGVTRGKIQVMPADSLPEDNTFFFTVERRPPMLVEVLSNRKSASVHFETALSTGVNQPFVVRIVPTPPRSIDAKKVRVFVINDMSQPPSASTIQSFLEDGGGVVVAAGPSTGVDSYQGTWEALLPARLVGKMYVRSRRKSFSFIGQADWEHPILSPFLGGQRSALTASRFFGFWETAPDADASSLARLEEGSPLLLEAERGKGRLLLFTSSLDSSWTDFPVRPSYVPFWSRVVAYAARLETAPAAYRVGQSLDVTDLETEGRAGTWNIIDPSGERVIGLDGEQPQSMRLELSGHYEIQRNRQTDWVAVNTQPPESLVTRVSPEDVRALFVSGQSALGPETDRGTTLVRERQQSLWWMMLLMAAVVLFVETWLANRHRRGPGGVL